MVRRLAAWVVGLGLAMGAAAQSNWPDRPVKLIVGATPGGSNDFVARVLAEPLAKVLGQSVLVENKPGVGSSLAADFVVKAPPDGYNILVGASASLSINPALDPKWASAQSLVPVVKLTSSPLIVTANAQTGFKSLKDLVDHAKANPGKLNVAHAGQGSLPHLGGVLFAQLTGINVVHVPFKGGAPAMQSLLSNDTQVSFATPPSVLPLMKSGKLVGLAVTVPDRFPLMPELPGARESGLANYNVDIWYGLFVPPGTPDAIVARIFEATNTVLQRPEVRTALAGGGMAVSALPSSAAFAAFVNEENRVWGRVARESGAKLD